LEKKKNCYLRTHTEERGNPDLVNDSSSKASKKGSLYH